MSRILVFAKRNFKEIIRDYLSLIFLIAMPLFFLVIFQQFNIPVAEYSIQNFTPSIVMFSYGFITLFAAQLVAKDKATSLLNRMFASPMKKIEYTLGYSLAMVPIAIAQTIIFFTVAVLLGLMLDMNIVVCMLTLIPISFLFIALGVLVGSATNEKQAPTFGSLIVQVVAFTSGMWFDLNMVGKVFGTVCKVLPFSHILNMTRNIMVGKYTDILPSILIVVAYTIVTFVFAEMAFKKKALSDNK